MWSFTEINGHINISKCGHLSLSYPTNYLCYFGASTFMVPYLQKKSAAWRRKCILFGADLA